MRNRKLEPGFSVGSLVLRIHVGGGVAVDLFANAALRWLCRAGFTPKVRILGVAR